MKSLAYKNFRTCLVRGVEIPQEVSKETPVERPLPHYRNAVVRKFQVKYEGGTLLVLVPDYGWHAIDESFNHPSVADLEEKLECTHLKVLALLYQAGVTTNSAKTIRVGFSGNEDNRSYVKKIVFEGHDILPTLIRINECVCTQREKGGYVEVPYSWKSDLTGGE